MQVITLGMDASWTGWGWCVANQHGPLRVGHLKLGPPRRRPRATASNPSPRMLSTHRVARLREYLYGPLDLVLADACLLRGPHDPPVRVVIEVPPLGYKRGNPSAYVGVGRLVGALELWGTRPSLATPWVLEPGDWRTWWGISPSGRGRGSEVLKAEACALVASRWGRAWLEPYSTAAGGKRAGPRGDVAESMLISVGASLHVRDAPASPRIWPASPTDVQCERG